MNKIEKQFVLATVTELQLVRVTLNALLPFVYTL
jgi:hypothetical protein